MFPKSHDVLYIYFRIHPNNLIFEVNAVDLTFDEVYLYAGKYAGLLSSMYFFNLGGIYLFFDRIYWKYCQTPENVTRSICLQCGTGAFLYANGVCAGNNILYYDIFVYFLYYTSIIIIIITCIIYVDCRAECSECVYVHYQCTACTPGHFPYDESLGCNTTTPVHHRFFQDNFWKSILLILEYIIVVVCSAECHECQNEKTNCSICSAANFKYTTGSTSTCLTQCDPQRQYAVETAVKKCEGIYYIIYISSVFRLRSAM